MHSREEKLRAFGRYVDVVDTLRVKCPWDRKQTLDSLRPNTIEEAYELADALLAGDYKNICKELGDVFLHILFYARIASENGAFDIADVCNAAADKLIFRHPHVYHPSQVGAPEPKPLPYGEDITVGCGDTTGMSGATTSAEVLRNWEQIKLREKDGNKSVLAGVPAALPSLIKAYRVQDKAANVGFDWQQRSDVWAKVYEELGELQAELELGDRNASEEEFGDFLFSLVNAARLYKIEPDNALERANRKFIRRFNYIERRAHEAGRRLKDMTLGEMDDLWNEAKRLEREHDDDTDTRQDDP